jgi:hypothetical protein
MFEQPSCRASSRMNTGTSDGPQGYMTGGTTSCDHRWSFTILKNQCPPQPTGNIK